MKSKLFALWLTLVLALHPSVMAAQSQQTSSGQDWGRVKQLPIGEKLAIELKDGRKIEGKALNISDAELSLTNNKQQTISMKRDEIRKIWIFSLPDPRKKKRYAGIGVGIGLFSALGIALSQMEKECGDCTGVKVGIGAALVGLPVAGALIGRKLGSRGKRLLIYQSP